MIGPRDSLVRMMLGEVVPLEDLLSDQSEFVDSDSWSRQRWHERPPELWSGQVHDYVHVEDD